MFVWLLGAPLGLVCGKGDSDGCVDEAACVGCVRVWGAAVGGMGAIAALEDQLEFLRGSRVGGLLDKVKALQCSIGLENVYA